MDSSTEEDEYRNIEQIRFVLLAAIVTGLADILLPFIHLGAWIVWMFAFVAVIWYLLEKETETYKNGEQSAHETSHMFALVMSLSVLLAIYPHEMTNGTPERSSDLLLWLDSAQISTLALTVFAFLFTHVFIYRLLRNNEFGSGESLEGAGTNRQN